MDWLVYGHFAILDRANVDDPLRIKCKSWDSPDNAIAISSSKLSTDTGPWTIKMAFSENLARLSSPTTEANNCDGQFLKNFFPKLLKLLASRQRESGVAVTTAPVSEGSEI